ncbi:DUF4129 domain-containing protein [Marinobacterium lutimaris]|uniref:Protein-glutamine gamma-glutamyltransferase-like C-terminal domain-containing protein n=1 Tax=Marinobacterium lutimaris TaxID=568106 RepID=A0A1H6D8K4_9GAMM|nr:DUF4129 domain-containing protein [Marinobacterium lutimaris]SEG81454.1 protein of unknown function [Marinobacterium lutimaris]
MNLNELQLKTRVRSSWQALDIGVLMARRWYRPLLLAWMLPALLLYGLLNLVLYDSPAWAMLGLWWCKPLLDRLPLLMLSRYIFNERPTGLFNWRSLLRLYRFDMLAALLWRRADMRRSFNLAVTVLEQQKGAARAKRCAALNPGCGRAASWLTLVMVHLELLVPISIVLALVAFAGSYIDIDPDLFLSVDAGVYAHLSNLGMLLGMSLVAPFYLGCGFSLYLNRRIELEAWDLELLFRESHRRRSDVDTGIEAGVEAGVEAKSAEQAEAKNSAKPAASDSANVLGLALAAWVGLGLLSPLAATPAEASVYSTEAAGAEQAREEIRQILETPPFVIEKQVEEWEWKDKPTEVPEPESLEGWEWLADLARWMDQMNLGWLFQLVEVLLWAALGLLLFLLTRALVKHLKAYNGPEYKPPQPVAGPRVIMGMEISADSLPEDMDAAITRAFEQGDMRLAVSLIYRHILHLLVDARRVPLESWYTELECAAAVRSRAELNVDSRFDELTRLWLRLAYAHQAPDRQQAERLYRELREVLAV